MNIINLKSETPLLQEHHFIATEFYGEKTVGFCYTEKEFVENSVLYKAYNTDFEHLPIKKESLDEINHDRYDSPYVKYGRHTYFCPSDFYIVCDKGEFGYNSSLHVFLCHVDKSDTEYGITITEIQDSDIIKRATEAFAKTPNSISRFINEHITTNITNFGNGLLPMDKVISHVENTSFLHVDEGSVYERLEVTPKIEGGYYLSFNLLHAGNKYKAVSSSDNTIDEGDYIYTRPMSDVVAISQVEYIAHSVYAKFFAVVKTAYVYPRDKAAIQEKFPDFYVEHCMSDGELERANLLKDAVSMTYIPENNQLGDQELYKKMSFTSELPCVEDGMFQLVVGYNGFIGSLSNAFWDERLRVERGSLQASLIQIGDKFKILFYRFQQMALCKGEYYGQFRYQSETNFFTSFDTPYSLFDEKRIAFSGMKYLLYRDKIKPIQISKERYEEFRRKDC